MEERSNRPPHSKELSSRLNGFWWWVIVLYSTLAILLAVNQIFSLKILGFMPIANGYYYYLVALYLPLVYLIYPATRSRAARSKVPWYDCILFLIAFITGIFFSANATNILLQGWEWRAPLTATVFSVILWALVLEACRRCEGRVLFIVCAAFSVYPMIANYMPGLLNGINFSFTKAAEFNAMGQESIIGIPVKTFGDLVIGFILLGIALQYTGGGKFFLDFSMALLGGTRGGPAKVAVIGSGLFGMLSGAAVSNVLTTGSFTIPAMKRSGYPPETAAAIEAVAATGGPLMPPVMGAVAFIMASFLTIPYAAVCAAAAVPAVLYYLGLFVQADGTAAILNMKGLPRSELPSLRATLIAGWPYILALLVLVYALIVLRMEASAPFYATALLLATAMAKKATRFTLKSFLELITASGKFLAELMAVMSSVGLIIGALSMTGVAPAFSGEMIALAGGNVLLLVLMGAIVCTILGTGMTISAAYIFVAITFAPAMVQVGINPIAAHLFILYWGLVSYLTPPVCMSAMVAAGIAGCDPMKAGLKSCQFAAVIYFIPFFFVFNPALLLNGPLVDIVSSVLFAILGVALIGYALVGYLPKVGHLTLAWKLTAAIGGVLLAFPHWYSHLAGLGVIAVSLLYLLALRLASKKALRAGKA